MTLGVRGKLLLFSLVLILLVVTIAGLFLERSRRAALESRIEEELLRQARVALELILESGAREIERIDPLADRLGRATASRITVIGADGQVLGESELPMEQVRMMDNHGIRPEVLGALQRGVGVYRRHSDTLDTDMLYLAVAFRFDDGEQPGAIRAAMPLAEVDRAITELRFNLFLAGLLGLLGTVLIGGLASHLLTRRLRQLVDHARSISRYPAASISKSEDDIQSLAGSFERIAEELQGQVDLLADERDRSDAILDCMSEALFALDERQRITLVNQAAESLFGFTRSPLGRTLPGATGEPMLGALFESLHSGQVAGTEFVLEGDGQRFLMAKAAPLRSGRGGVVVIHDITDIRRMERLNREFVANASHELRTPVTVIRANAEMLLDSALDDTDSTRKLLEAVDRNAERLTNILSDLLNLARLDARQYQVERESIQLLAFFESALPALQPLARSKQIGLELRIPADSRVLADAGALEQILFNLLENAIKYTPDGGRIWITRQIRGDWLRLSIEDNGPGIAESHRERLFQRFYRVDTGRSRSMGGTGLGLAIVKELANAMGGRVGMESNQPSGSIFWVELPTAWDWPVMPGTE